MTYGIIVGQFSLNDSDLWKPVYKGMVHYVHEINISLLIWKRPEAHHRLFDFQSPKSANWLILPRLFLPCQDIPQYERAVDEHESISKNYLALGRQMPFSSN